MTHVNIAGRIRTQPEKQTGTLGAALKAKLAEQEQKEQEEPVVTLTISRRYDSGRMLFHLSFDQGQQGNELRSGIFYGNDHAASFVSDLLDRHPHASVIDRTKGHH